MRFFEENFIPKNLSPDWDFWSKKITAPLNELVKLSLGINPKIDIENYFKVEIHKEKSLICHKNIDPAFVKVTGSNYSKTTGSSLTKQRIEHNKSVERIHKLQNTELEIKLAIADYIDIANDHIALKILKIPEKYHSKDLFGKRTKITNPTLYIEDFIQWLNEQSFTYPKELSKPYSKQENSLNKKQSNIQFYKEDSVPVQIQFYKDDVIPLEHQPDWEFWGRKGVASLKELVALAINVEPTSPILNIYQSNFEEYDGYHAPDPTGITKIDFVEKCVKDEIVSSIIKLLDLALSHTTDLGGILEIITTHDKYTIKTFKLGMNGSVKVSNFVNWLDSQNIPYPVQLKNCMRMRDKPTEEKELTPSEKSGLTQKYNKLQQIFNSMVELHYGETVSAGKIYKDFQNHLDVNGNNKPLIGSKNTIQAHLTK